MPFIIQMEKDFSLRNENNGEENQSFDMKRFKRQFPGKTFCRSALKRVIAVSQVAVSQYCVQKLLTFRRIFQDYAYAFIIIPYFIIMHDLPSRVIVAIV